MYATFLHPEFESASARQIAELQSQKWLRQWERLRSSRFYQRHFGSRAFTRLADLEALPFTTKDDLRRSQETEPPYGDYICCRPDQVVRIHRTSGTTGTAMVLAASKRDTEITHLLGGRGFYAAGLRPGDRVVHCLNYQLWTGGVTDHLCLEATGATVIPFGTGGAKRLIEIIPELGITAISCTPSYPALLEEIVRENGKNPRDLGLRLGLFGGEAGLDNAAFREKLEATWGFRVRNANFGLSEVMSIMGAQCEAGTDLHFHAEDYVFVELIDPVTDKRLAISPGATGELVFTHLEKECQPLVRYRARDVVTITATEPCACGRTSFRFRVTGRTDDMFNVRGINVFPTAVQRVIAAHADALSGHFRIVLSGPGPYARIPVKAEVVRGLPEANWPAIAKKLEDAIKIAIGAGAEVTLVPYESLGRTDGKTSIIERVKA